MHIIFIADCFRWPSSGANSVAGRKGETSLPVPAGKVERVKSYQDMHTSAKRK